MKKNYFVISAFLAFGTVMSFGQANMSNRFSPISSVPEVTFSENAVQQEEELKTNVDMLRFAESRKNAPADPYRPIYHFSSPEGGLGDPTGLLLWQGKLHLFYLGSSPDKNIPGHWGHAVSEDMIHFRDLPNAIYPLPELRNFSGGSYVDGDTAIIVYYGPGEGIMEAVADDPLLLNWDKIPGNTGNAIIPARSTTGFPLPYSVFDPCIWKSDGMYYIMSAGKQTFWGDRVMAAGWLFRSKDLKKWEFVHQFVENDRFTLTGDDFACPYFWPLGDRNIFYFYSHMSGGQYLIGDYNKEEQKFYATAGSGHSGIGPNTSTTDGKGGVIMMGKVGSYLSIPRLITLIKDDQVGQQPAGDFSALRYDGKHLENIQMPANKEVVLKGIQGNAMEISAEINMNKSQMIEMNILRSPDKSEYTRIVIYREKDYNYFGNPYISTSESATMPSDLLPLYAGEGIIVPGMPTRPVNCSLVSLQTENSSSVVPGTVNAPMTLPFILNRDETVKLRVFIDKSVIEVFVNGTQVLCAVARPSRKDSLGVSVKSTGEQATLVSLDAWQMHGIY
jgi:beta-fructofuranosidase